MLERVDDGKVSLQSHGHGHVHRSSPCNVESSVQEGNQVNGNVLPVPTRKTILLKNCFKIVEKCSLLISRENLYCKFHPPLPMVQVLGGYFSSVKDLIYCQLVV